VVGENGTDDLFNQLACLGTWRPATGAWNAHHDERGLASMDIYHVTIGTPVVVFLHPGRTPPSTEQCASQIERSARHSKAGPRPPAAYFV
jgi:hypothetical protein